MKEVSPDDNAVDRVVVVHAGPEDVSVVCAEPMYKTRSLLGNYNGQMNTSDFASPVITNLTHNRKAGDRF